MAAELGAWSDRQLSQRTFLSLRVPDFRKIEASILDRLASAEKVAAQNPCLPNLHALDEAAAELYELDRFELVLARESVERARMLIFEGRASRRVFVRPPHREPLRAYAATVASVVDTYLRTKGMRHLEAAFYSKPLISTNWSDGTGGLTAVRFRTETGAPPREPAVEDSEDAELSALAAQLQGWMKAELPPYLNERRNLASTSVTVCFW